MIDLHCHILPGLDDGAPNLTVSLAMAERAERSGIHVIAATPHIREDHPFPADQLQSRVEALNLELRHAETAIRVVSGGELAVSQASDVDDEILGAIRLGGGPYVLVESPYSEVGDLLEHVLYDLQLRGVRILLGHPERSPCFLERPDRLAALVEGGVLCSVTAASMAGQFGGTVRSFARDLFKADFVHDVSSDAHDARTRPPDLRAGFESLDREVPGLLDQVEWFTEESPRAILAGEPLPGRPQSRSRRGLKRLIRPALRRRGVSSA